MSLGLCLWFCLALVSRLHVLAAKTTCDHFEGFDSNGIPTLVDIVDKQSNRQALEAGSSQLHVIHVVNGTQYLHLGGSLQDFELVVGKKYTSSSDLTLQEALNSHQQSILKHGIILQTWPDALRELALAVSEQYNLEAVWSSMPREDVTLSSPERPVNILWNEGFGLDLIYSRMASENVLLDHDFTRIRGLVDDLYLARLEDSEVRYLRTAWRKYQRSGTVGQESTASITELFVESLLHLIDHFNDKGSLGKLQLLPDLQKPKNLEPYRLSDVQSLLSLLEGSSHCHVLTLRAGLLLLQDNRSEVVAVINRSPRLKVVLEVRPFDDLRLEDLKALVGDFDLSKRYLQIDEQKMQHLEAESEQRKRELARPRIPTPTVSHTSGSPRIAESRSLALLVATVFLVLFRV